MKSSCAIVASIVVFSSLAGTALAGSWPQWRGPGREGICTETGLLAEWPDGGPPLLWEARGLGKGFSSMAIVGDTLYTMGDLDGENAQFVISFDLAEKKRKWATKVGRPHGDGARGTPTVQDGLVHALGTDGDLVCVEADSGKEVWRKSYQKDFGPVKTPEWKFSESPLVDGNVLVCTPGHVDALLVALDRKTGETIWKCSLPESERKGKIHAQYSSPVVAEVGGIRQYLTLIFDKGLVGVSARDGKFLWSYKRISNGVANIPTAVVRGDHVFCSTAYGTGSALLKLVADGGSVKAEEVYFLDGDTFQNHHGGFVRLGDYIYGGHGHNAAAPICVELMTGKVMWKAKQPGRESGNVLYADGSLYFRYQDNTVALVDANPREYKLKGTFKLPKKEGMGGPGWAHPVILDGKLYLRHNDWLFCYDVKARTATVKN